MAKRVSAYTIVADVGASTVAARTADGKREIVVRVVDLDEGLRMQAMVHGIKQKIGDAGAKSADSATGKVDQATKTDAVFAMAERIKRGVWNERGVAGTSDATILLRALARVYPERQAASLSEWVAGLKGNEVSALLGNARVAPHVAAIRAELAGAVDGDSLLEGLEEAGA